MTIPVKERRPRVISEALAADLDDYLSFRYIFRNIYGFELQGDRLTWLASRLPSISRRFEEEVLLFVSCLEGST